MKRYLLASAVVIAFVPFKAQAAQIDAAGAAHLKEVFSNILKDQKEINEAFGSVEVVYSGDVTVEPKGEYYAVILPKISFKPGEKLKEAVAGAAPTPQDPAAPTPPDALGFSFDLGQTAINAIPDDKAGYWKMTVALPDTMTFGVAQEFAANINIGKQNSSGLFHEESGNFVKLNSEFSDIKFSMTANGEVTDFTVPKLNINSNLEEDGPGYVTGPTTIRVSGLGFDVPDEHARVDLGALQVNVNLTRYKLMPLSEYKAKFITFGEKMKIIETAAETNTPPTAAQIEEIVNAALAINDFDGMSFQYGLENLAFSANPPKDDFASAEALKSLKIANASVGVGIEGLKTETSAINMKFGYSGVSVDPVPAGYEGVIPDAVNIDLSAGKIPLQSLWTAGLNAGKAVAANPEAGAMAAMGLMMQVPMMLTQAGTEIAVKDNFVSAKDYKATLNGLVKADPAAVMQFIADLKGRFDGLDELLARVQASASKPDFANAYEFKDIADQLAMLKQYGEAAAGPDGKPGYNFDIKVTADGKTTINGKDLPMGGPGAEPGAMGEQTPAAGDE